MENRKKAHTVFYSILTLWIKSLLAMVHDYVMLFTYMARNKSKYSAIHLCYV